MPSRISGYGMIFENQPILKYNKMKKSILTLAVVAALLFSNSFAQVVVTDKGGTNTNTGTSTQDPKSKQDPKDVVQGEMSKDAATTAKEWTQKMDEICNLTPDQEKKIMAINLRYANQIEELKAKYRAMDNPNADAAKAEKDELTKRRLREYSDVLTKEQMQKFKAYRDSMKGDDHPSSNSNKEKAKDKYKSGTPEEQERMQQEMKEKKEERQEDKEKRNN